MASAEAPRYREVADALRRQIAAGELGSHDRLAWSGRSPTASGAPG